MRARLHALGRAATSARRVCRDGVSVAPVGGNVRRGRLSIELELGVFPMRSGFVERAEMRQLRPDFYHYQSDHAAIVRQAPRPSRLVQEFLECLCHAHATADGLH